MEVITNMFLYAITKDKELVKRLSRFESPELKEIDSKMNIEAAENFIELCTHNIGFRKLWKDLTVPGHNQILTKIALTHYNAKKAIELRGEIEKQIADCEDFLKKDMCKRNLELAKHVNDELKKLKSAVHENHIRDIIRAFDLLIQKRNPKMSNIKRSIEISEILHHLKLFENKAFLTLLEATEIVSNKLSNDSEYTQTAERLVYDRIRKYL